MILSDVAREGLSELLEELTQLGVPGKGSRRDFTTTGPNDKWCGDITEISQHPDARTPSAFRSLQVGISRRPAWFGGRVKWVEDVAGDVVRGDTSCGGAAVKFVMGLERVCVLCR